MEPPKKSYRIWFSQRNGSTLLCEGLSATGVAGKPGEHFNLITAGSLAEKYGVSIYEALKQKLWETGSTSNGVFGVKYGMRSDGYQMHFEEILRLRHLENRPDLDHEVIWSDLFPNCKHIYLTRRNKVRQAVSWWKAINDQVWHLQKGQSHENEAAFYEEKYDYDALWTLFKEANLRECAMQAYFSKYKIAPLNLVYEDMVLDFRGTINRILEYLEIAPANIPEVGFRLEKTSSGSSEEWVQRFRKDLQGGQKIW